MAQGEFILYNLNKSVPQAHQLNPAFAPDAKVVVGLPVLSSSHVSVDMDKLNFNTVFTESSEQVLTVDFDNLSSALGEKNNFSVKTDLQLFFLGLNIKNNFFSLAVNERMDSWFRYSKDVVDLAIYGNGDERTFGRNVSFDQMKLKQNFYHEVALGFSRSFMDKLRVGARIKFLSGVINSQTDQLQGYIRTDTDSIHIAGSSLRFNNSGVTYFANGGEVLPLLENTMPFVGGNSGLGFDFGASYQINEKISVSASMTDIGYINWKENTSSYQLNDINYSFKGFDLLDLINDGDGESDFLQNELDSLESIFEVNELDNITYKSSLTSNFYIGGDYALAKNHHVGAQVYGRIIEGNISPEFAAYYNLKVGRVLNTVFNAGFRNGKLSSVGAGMSVDLGPVQLYATTESVTSLLKPDAASMLDARVGLNLVFGKKKKKQLVEEKSEEEELLAKEEAEEEVEPQELDNSIDQGNVSESKNMAPVAIPVAAAAAASIIEKPVEEPTGNLSSEKDEVVEEQFDALAATENANPKPKNEVVKDKPASKVVVIKQGDHKDELSLGHYIVVGAFLSKTNAEKYSNRLKAKGYSNEYGFLTKKDYYYVTVFKTNGNADEARAVRDDFRKKDEFLFPDSWLLSVVE